MDSHTMIWFEQEVKCTVTDCKPDSQVGHVILFRDVERPDQLYCQYSCSSCIHQVLGWLTGPVENVLSIKKKGIGNLTWVVFKKEWLSEAKWCEYDHKKLLWSDPAPWEEEPCEILVTHLLNDRSTKDRITRYIDECRGNSSVLNSVSIHKTPPQTYALKLDYRVRDDFTDFTIKVGDREFFVHRVIMAQRSEYFNGMLTINMKEKSLAVVEMTEVTPETFEIYLDIVYHDDENITTECVDELLALADRIRDVKLTEMCAHFLSRERISPEIYEMALRYNLEGLQKSILTQLAPVRSPNDYLKGRLFDALPEEFEKFETMSKDMLSGILKVKVSEMSRTGKSVIHYAKEVSSILDNRLKSWMNGEFYCPTDISLSLTQVQEIKALLMLMISSTCVSDHTLLAMGNVIGTVRGIESRALNCGPCSTPTCKRTTLGQKDHWRIDPLIDVDIPGTYLCGRCFKTQEGDKQAKKRKMFHLSDPGADSDE